MKTILFFALRDDIINVIKNVEIKVQLQYCKIGNYAAGEKDKISILHSGLDIPDLGIGKGAYRLDGDSYLVQESKSQLEYRYLETQQRDRFVAIDQELNTASVVFTPAGQLNEHTILAGAIDTVHNTKESQRLMRLFNNAMKRMYTKVKTFYVGPLAYEILEDGGRLAFASINASSDFNLSLD